MEAPIEEVTSNPEESNHEAVKGINTAVEKDPLSLESTVEIPELIKLPETNEPEDKAESSENIIENSISTEPITLDPLAVKEPEGSDNPIKGSKVDDTQVVDNPTVIVELPDSAISEENVTSGEALVEESVSTTVEEEGLNKDVTAISDNSDQSIVLPVEELSDEKLNDSDETVIEPITELVEEEEVSIIENEISEEPVLTTEIDPLQEECSADPPVLEQNSVIEDATVINGMPVLHKEIEEIDDDGQKIILIPSESETIEIIREEASGSPEKKYRSDDSSKEVFIPPHILGCNLERPTGEEHMRNGKVRKPRLGVKIPCRNLTSQIVSGKEIEEEIMERSRQRNASADLPAGGDIFFAKKLTQRLAKKIIEKSSGIKSSPTTSKAVSEGKPLVDSSAKIQDNSDLIALLEGDDDIDWTPTNPAKKFEKRTPEWERETALKQLRELPKSSKSSRGSSSKLSSPSKNTVEKPKESELTPPSLESAVSPPVDDNNEPKFSMGVVTKTYTRKRKSSTDIKLITSSILQSQKKVHVDKEKEKEKSSSPQTPKQSEKTSQKSSENSKGSTSKSHKPKTLLEKKEMPILKKESPIIVHEHKLVSPKVQKTLEEKRLSQIPPEKANPHVLISKTEVPIKTPDVVVSAQLSPNTYISKSSRIVKKKKIWDPDEDITPKYFKPKSPKFVEEKKPEKSVEKKMDKVLEVKVDKVQSVQPDKPVLKPSNERALPKKGTIKKIIAKKKKPKRLSEIDRLLMDEGAVNLLYAVKNTEDLQNFARKKGSKAFVSLDRAQRELLNKTNEIKNDLQINSTKDSPISLRKKEIGVKISPSKEVAAAILQRKKSTGSTHSPPASPAFYNQHAEASRIIRRHSSSSFSSENADDESGEKTSSKKSSGESQKKKIRAHSERQSSSMGVDKQLLSEEMAKNFNNAMPLDAKYTQFETFNIKTHDKFVQIILSPSGPNARTTMSAQTLKELTKILNVLKDDNDCHAVLLSSSGISFCQGIDYKQLATNKISDCLNTSERLANHVKNFLITILNFPKLLVAGVHGHTIGLGVTMLPLFDMVLASDSATFSTPYTSLGCAAEGGVLFTLPHVMHNALASELFFAARKLTAAEAHRLGLVTRTLWPDKFQEELIAALKSTSRQSLQSMQAIKSQLRSPLKASIKSALDEESSVLIQHWTSEECQSKFPNYNIERK